MSDKFIDYVDAAQKKILEALAAHKEALALISQTSNTTAEFHLSNKLGQGSPIGELNVTHVKCKTPSLTDAPKETPTSLAWLRIQDYVTNEGNIRENADPKSISGYKALHLLSRAIQLSEQVEIGAIGVGEAANQFIIMEYTIDSKFSNLNTTVNSKPEINLINVNCWSNAIYPKGTSQQQKDDPAYADEIHPDSTKPQIQKENLGVSYHEIVEGIQEKMNATLPKFPLVCCCGADMSGCSGNEITAIQAQDTAYHKQQDLKSGNETPKVSQKPGSYVVDPEPESGPKWKWPSGAKKWLIEDNGKYKFVDDLPDNKASLVLPTSIYAKVSDSPHFIAQGEKLHKQLKDHKAKKLTAKWSLDTAEELKQKALDKTSLTIEECQKLALKKPSDTPNPQHLCSEHLGTIGLCTICPPKGIPKIQATIDDANPLLETKTESLKFSDPKEFVPKKGILTKGKTTYGTITLTDEEYEKLKKPLPYVEQCYCKYDKPNSLGMPTEMAKADAAYHDKIFKAKYADILNNTSFCEKHQLKLVMNIPCQLCVEDAVDATKARDKALKIQAATAECKGVGTMCIICGDTELKCSHINPVEKCPLWPCDPNGPKMPEPNKMHLASCFKAKKHIAKFKAKKLQSVDSLYESNSASYNKASKSQKAKKPKKKKTKGA